MSKYLINKFLYTIDRDPDLAEVRDLPGYDAVLRESGARAAAYNSVASPGPPAVVHPDGPARGVLVALHGSGGRPAIAGNGVCGGESSLGSAASSAAV